jgi:hypothetical protein
MAFRYNAGRALMMGVRQGQRLPLWVQRLRSAEVLLQENGTPKLIRRAETPEDYFATLNF